VVEASGLDGRRRAGPVGRVTWLAVPSIVKNQVEKLATEQLGRRVTLHDLAVARADGVADPSPQLLVKRF